MTAAPAPADQRLTPPLVLRLRELTVAVALVAVAFQQASGQVVADTKLDLVLDPGTFLGRAFSAWDSTAAFGQLQNQAYGYLFPMGPFFLLADTAGIPDWVTQRLWWSLLLVVAFTGVLRLTTLLGIGTHPARLVAAAAYALSPRVLTTLGGISVESWPLALAPWVLVPLVAGAAGGSPRRHALASCLVVAATGGVNASATLVVLVLPVLYLLTREPGPRRRALAAWWAGGVVLATAWWVLPLIVLGRYSVPFLDYIETASITTSVTSLTNVLRGTSHWVAYAPSLGEPLWPAGSWLAGAAVAVAATALVAAAGLAGLAHPRMPERRFLLTGLLLGVVAISVGHDGTLTSPLAGSVQGLLDGALAPLRNVHKADPVLRLPLALGLAHLLALAPGWARRWREKVSPARAARLGLPSPVALSAVVVGALCLPLVVAGAPAPRDQIAPAGAFASVPSYWQHASDWLDERPRGRTLVVPGAAFGDYLWGRPRDEPLQAYAGTPWVVRNAVPLGSAGATRLLDALGAELAAGRPSAGLAGALARAGVGRVLLRHDLDARVTPDPSAVARATLASSPGLHRVAGFGPRLVGPYGLVGGVAGPPVRLRALEVFEVDAPPQVVLAADRGSAPALAGGAEATVDLYDAVTHPPRALLGAGDATSGLVVTDTLRRRSLAFGAAVGAGYSATLPASADADRGRPAADVLPPGAAGGLTGVRYDGVRSVTASSTAADPFQPGWRGPGTRPYAAFDGDPATAWVSGPRRGDQWVELRWARPRVLGRIEVRAGGGVGVATPTGVVVRTGTGSVRAPFVGGRASVDPVAGETRRLRVAVLRAPGSAPEPVALAEVSVAGVRVVERVVLAGSPATPGPVTWSLRRTPSRAECVRPLRAFVCSPALSRAGEDGATWRRTLSARTAAEVSPRVLARRLPGPDLDRRLDAALGYRASASSAYVADPAARPGAAFDGDPGTAWLPGAADFEPTVTLELPDPVTVTRLDLVARRDTRRRIRAVAVEAGDERRVVRPDRRGVAVFPALTGPTLTVTLLLDAARLSGPLMEPLRVAELRLPELPVPSRDAVVDLSCDEGPRLQVGGLHTRFAARATVQQLVADDPVAVRPCGATRLPAGRSEVVAVPGGGLVADSVVLAPAGGGPGSGRSRGAELEVVDDEHRRVRVDAGDDAVLVLSDSTNAGWTATSGGDLLEPVTVDGWRQGFLLPAGPGTEVLVEYAPGAWHRAGLALGVVLLALLLALALTRSRHGTAPPSTARSVGAAAMGVACLVVPALLAGLVGLLVGVCVLAARRTLPDRHRAVAMAVALGAAGVAAAVSDDPTGGSVAQALALVSVTLAAAALSPGQARRLGLPATRHRSAVPAEEGVLEQRP